MSYNTRNVVQRSEVFENIERKKCNKCGINKTLVFFTANKKSKDGVGTICRQCENDRQQKSREVAANYVYPYRGVNDPKYIKDKASFFLGHNGWYWGEGWWSDKPPETPMELQRRYRREKEGPLPPNKQGKSF